MSTLILTSHAVVRMAQRGIKLKDADLITLIGTEVEDGYLVRYKDYQQIECALKSLLGRFKRIVGKRLVIADGRVITAYHASSNLQRRLIRRSRISNLHD
jgi:hypothetical protein